MGLPGGSDGKESADIAGDLGSVPESGRSPGEGTSYSLQCSCLENSIDRGAWQATFYGVSNSQTGGDYHFHFHRSQMDLGICSSQLLPKIAMISQVWENEA